MEFGATAINQIVVPQMEPIKQLAPYLNDINVCDAVESLNRLADSLLHCSQSEDQSNEQLGSLAVSPSSEYSSGQYWSQSPPTAIAVASSPASSQWSYSSTCSDSGSPGPSERACSSFYGSWSSGASSPSSGPASVASSCGDAYSFGLAELAYASQSSSSNDQANSPRPSDRRKKNATAAERYRKKLKGRESGLADQMEREQRRNARLRRDVEAKLSLYREFVSLLAQNTGQNDVELASLGSKSLSAILSGARAHPATPLDEGIGFELQELLTRFQAILSASNQQKLAQDSSTNDHSLVYDFFTGNFVDHYSAVAANNVTY